MIGSGKKNKKPLAVEAGQGKWPGAGHFPLALSILLVRCVKGKLASLTRYARP